MKTLKEKYEYNKRYYYANKSKLTEKRKVFNKDNAQEIRQNMKQYVAANREKIREYQRNLQTGLKKYGLTIKGYNDLLEKQNGLCAICKRPPAVEKLAVDHDHATGKVRGLLCRKCNSAIGFLDDDFILVANALIYLKGDSDE